MFPKTLLLCAAVVSVTCVASVSRATIIGGVEFPLGEPSFADGVVSFTAGTGGVSEPASNALALPDDVDVSLGNGGELIVEFIDNFLVDQDSVEGGLDLFVFERGVQTETMEVFISEDNINFLSLGVVEGQPAGIDIGPFVSAGDKFRYVKIVDEAADNNQTGGFAGVDIDAIGAVGSIFIPEPVSLLLLSVGAAIAVASRRRS